MSKKVFKILPVGWGSANALIVYSTPSKSLAVITDGGTQPKCYKYLCSSVWEKFNRIIKKSFFRIWIASHFDYDHYSIVSSILSSSNLNMNICVLPYVYNVDECRYALALLDAIKSVLFARPPKLPIALESILDHCSESWFVKEGYEIRIDNSTSYEILWPPEGVASEICKKIIDTLKDRVVKRLRRQQEVEERADQFMKRLNGIKRKAREGRVLDVQAILRQALEDRYIRPPEIVRPLKFEKSRLECEFYTGDHYYKYYNHFPELSLATRDLINIYSIAYAINDDGFMYGMEINEYCNEADHCNGSSRPPFMEIMGFSILPILYLADLDENSLETVLNKLIDTPLIAIAPHHGNTWSDKIRGLITYIHRCSSHVPINYRYGEARLEEYCSRSLCIISDHNLGLELRLK